MLAATVSLGRNIFTKPLPTRALADAAPYEGLSRGSQWHGYGEAPGGQKAPESALSQADQSDDDICCHPASHFLVALSQLFEGHRRNSVLARRIYCNAFLFVPLLQLFQVWCLVMQ